MVYRLMAIVVFLGIPSTGRADDAAVEDSAPRSERPLALWVSPLYAAAAHLVEVGGEYNVSGRMATGLSLVFGPTTSPTQDESGDFYSDDVLCLGAKGNFHYYALGSFDSGLYVGGDAVFYYLTRDRDSAVRGVEEGFWLGPAVGYKHTFDFGLTLGASFGAYLPLYRPKGLDEDLIPGDLEQDDSLKAGPVLLGPNAAIGWAI